MIEPTPNPRATSFTVCKHYPSGCYDAEPCPFCPAEHQSAAAARGWAVDA